jgi:hypothetical protein
LAKLPWLGSAEEDMMRVAGLALCVCGVLGCTGIRQTIGLGKSPRVELSYFEPASRVAAAVNAATVTVQNSDDTRNLDLALKITAPEDSAIVVILEDRFLLSRLEPLVGSNGVAQIALSQRAAGTGIALPLIEVSAESPWVPLPRKTIDVLFDGVSVGDAGLCIVAPTRKAALRFRQLVYPTPATKNGRYRLRVNWISFPAAGIPVTTHCEPGRPAARSLSLPKSALANELEAYGRRVDLNWLGVILLGTLALLGVAQIAGS